MDTADRVMDLLDTLKAPSEFCCYGTLHPVLPGLEVDGVGPVGLPVSPTRARAMIRQAEQAPFGRGEETVVDTRVRRVWQLAPDRFALKSPEWDETMAELVEEIRSFFDLPAPLQARLYKLLVYEKGGFFVPHRDTEKEDGMCATLVVSLPSRHTGGRLLVEHGLETREVDFGGALSGFALQYAAFYADCRHEVEPVESGFRVCLVYNLVRPRGKRARKAPPPAGAEPLAAALAEALESRAKVAIPLEHEYTKAGFSADALKGGDRGRVALLGQAADQAGLDLRLALLTIHQLAEVEPFDDFPRRRRSLPDPDDVEISEIYEDSLTLDDWADGQGPGVLHLDPEEVLCRGGLDGLGGEKTLHEATGNEGVTLERWYRGAVAVLWPRSRYFTILAREGQDTAVPVLAAMLKDGSPREDCLRLAEAILSLWSFRPRAWCESSVSGAMLRALERLGDEGLAERFVREVLPRDYDGTEGAALRRLGDRVGWPKLAGALAGFVAEQVPAGGGSLPALAAVVEGLCKGGKGADGRLPACAPAARELASVLRVWDEAPRRPWDSRARRQGVLESTFQALSAVGEVDLLDAVVARCLAPGAPYDLHEVLIPALRTLHRSGAPGGPALQRLKDHCLEALRKRTAEPVTVPNHWSLPAELPCRCGDCRELRRFLAHPQEREFRFRAAQHRRDHLQSRCEDHALDLDYRTERSGSPYTLVLTKNRKSYEERQKAFEQDLRLLEELTRLG